MEALFVDQNNAILKLRWFKVGALFMEPGTGKTRAAYEIVKRAFECDYILWLTPFQTKQNLRDELKKWYLNDNVRHGEFDRLFDVVGIETMSNSDRVYLELILKLDKSSCPFIVVDESLKIKNWDAKRTKRIIELGKRAHFKLVLNGTPLSKNLLDIWAQMEFLSPKILKMGLTEFKNTFCEWTKITRRIGNRSFTKEFITKYHNVDHLYSLIGHYVYECDLELEIGKQYHDVAYKIEDDIKEQYHYLKAKYLNDEKLQAMNNNIFLELTQKMQHLYCISEEKYDLVREILNTNDPSQVIAFTKFIASGDKLRALFPGITVLSYGKHAHGLNLQQFNVCIFFDKTWDYAQRIQSEARIYRKGQKNQCIFYDLTGDVGLESMISKNIEKKQGLLEYFKSKAVKEILNEL